MKMTDSTPTCLGLIILGPPGAGKGSVAKLLAERLGVVHISTGDLIRDAINSADELGRRLESVVASGGLVDDDTVEELLQRRLDSKEANRFLFDGYPRNLNQARRLERVLESAGCDLAAALALRVPSDEVVRRLETRRACPCCGHVYNLSTNPPKRELLCDHDDAELIQRSDDNAETVRRRLEVYEEKTAPLLEHYRALSRLVEIDGVGSIETVYERVSEAVGELLAKRD